MESSASATGLGDGGQHEEVLGWPGAAQAEMGRGRRMGQGWIQVAAEAIVTDD